MKLKAEQSKKVNELRRLVNKEFSLYGKVVFADYDEVFNVHLFKLVNQFGTITELTFMRTFDGNFYGRQQMLSNIMVLEPSEVDISFSYPWHEELRNALNSIDFEYAKIF